MRSRLYPTWEAGGCELGTYDSKVYKQVYTLEEDGAEVESPLSSFK